MTVTIRLPRFILLLICALILVSCSQGTSELVLARPASPVDEEVANSLAELFGNESDIGLNLTAAKLSEESAIDALLAGTIDLALISNNMPYREGIATVIPMYPTVLHLGHLGGREFSNIGELLRGAVVFAGPEGSASRFMFQKVINRLGVLPDQFSFVEDPDKSPDVVVIFAPISPDRLRDYPEFRMISLGSPDSIGTGAPIDATTLLNPYFRPFVIPVGTYGDATPEPILTLAVDKILVARRDLNNSVVYDLVNEIVRLRPALSAQKPGLFQNLSGEFDANRSTFVLHTGAQAYLQRSAPSIYERYSGIAEVGMSVLIAVVSAIFAGVKIFRLRRKNRIDTFYAETIRLRDSVASKAGDEEKRAVSDSIRNLQKTAYEMLIDEQLAADESFRIFITLSNDALDQIGD